MSSMSAAERIPRNDLHNHPIPPAQSFARYIRGKFWAEAGWAGKILATSFRIPTLLRSVRLLLLRKKRTLCPSETRTIDPPTFPLGTCVRNILGRVAAFTLPAVMWKAYDNETRDAKTERSVACVRRGIVLYWQPSRWVPRATISEQTDMLLLETV